MLSGSAGNWCATATSCPLGHHPPCRVNVCDCERRLTESFKFYLAFENRCVFQYWVAPARFPLHFGQILITPVHISLLARVGMTHSLLQVLLVNRWIEPFCANLHESIHVAHPKFFGPHSREQSINRSSTGPQIRNLSLWSWWNKSNAELVK